MIIQNYTITMTMKLAVDVRARLAVIDPVAVADVEALLAATWPVTRNAGIPAGKSGKTAVCRFAGHQANDTRMEVQSVTLARHVPVRKNAFFRASMDAGS